MRGNFCDRASVASQRQFSSLNQSLNHYRQGLEKKTRIAAIALLLGLGGGGWAITEAIAPQIAQAETKRLDISLYRQSDEPYEALINRAEAATSQAVRESFEQGTQVTDVSVTVVGHHMGAIAPVLSLDVNRSEWQRNPNVQSWSKYFMSARSLLRFDEDLANTNPSQSNTSNTYNRSIYRRTQSPRNSNTPRRTQSSPSNSSTSGQNQFSPSNSGTSGPNQSPPIPGSARGNNNSVNQSGTVNPSTSGGGFIPNSTSGQSGNFPSPTSPSSNSSSGTNISSPETLTPSTIAPPEQFQNQNSFNDNSSGSGLPSTSTLEVPSGIRNTTTNLEGR